MESLRKKYQEEQLQYCKLSCEMPILAGKLKRVQDELKNYSTAAGNSGERQKSYKLVNKIFLNC